MRQRDVVRTERPVAAGGLGKRRKVGQHAALLAVRDLGDGAAGAGAQLLALGPTMQSSVWPPRPASATYTAPERATSIPRGLSRPLAITSTLGRS